MQEQIQKLRDAGFDDNQISEWIASNKDQAGVTSAPGANTAEADVPFSATPTMPPPGSEGGIGNWPQNVSEGLAAVNSFISSPLGHALATGGVTAYGGKKLVEAANALRGGSTPVAGPSAGMQAPVQQTMTGTGQTMRVMPGGQVSGPVVPTQAPVAQPAPQMSAPAAGVKAGSMLDNASQIVRKLALSKILPAAQVGAGLFYTSPEEIATLKAAEARKKALGQ